MKILVNGEAKDVQIGLTVAELVETLKKQPRYIAVERNQVLVPRAQHQRCVLEENDEVEIVTLVGGG